MMICIGIDPSLNSTGIVVLTKEGEEVKTWGSVNITHKVNKASKKRSADEGVFKALFVNKPAVIEGVDISSYSFPFSQSYVIESNDAIVTEIFAYYDICCRVFQKLQKDFAVPLIMNSGNCLVALEVPFGHHQGNSSKTDRLFSAMASVIRVSLPVLPQVITPTQLKKFVTGKNTAKKELVMKEVYKKFGFDTDINDIADAYGLARMLTDGGI